MKILMSLLSYFQKSFGSLIARSKRATLTALIEHFSEVGGSQFSSEVAANMESNQTEVPEIRIDIDEVAADIIMAEDFFRAASSEHTTETEMKMFLHGIFIERNDVNSLAVIKQGNRNPEGNNLVKPSYFFKVVETTFGFTSAAGYSILSSNIVCPPQEKFAFMGATMAGFIGTLSSMLLRDKMPKIARVLGKAGVFAGTIGVIGCYGMQMQLSSRGYWAFLCGFGVLVPAAVLLYA